MVRAGVMSDILRQHMKNGERQPGLLYISYTVSFCMLAPSETHLNDSQAGSFRYSKDYVEFVQAI